MASAIENYRTMVDQPWGRMFYDQIFRQLIMPAEPKKKILDFGAGFCLTAIHYGKDHDVTAVEPGEEMRALRVKSENYTLVGQGLEYLSGVEDNTYDVVICHNVLEYVEDKDAILKELVRVLKPGGIMSIIKHNVFGRALATAVMSNDPKAALDLLNGDEENSMFGNRSVYSNAYLDDFFGGRMAFQERYGIRAFFGLSSNNEIKYTDDWYRPMLELETKASTMDEYKNIAFFNHLIYKKNA